MQWKRERKKERKRERERKKERERERERKKEREKEREREIITTTNKIILSSSTSSIFWSTHQFSTKHTPISSLQPPLSNYHTNSYIRTLSLFLSGVFLIKSIIITIIGYLLYGLIIYTCALRSVEMDQWTRALLFGLVLPIIKAGIVKLFIMLCSRILDDIKSTKKRQALGVMIIVGQFITGIIIIIIININNNNNNNNNTVIIIIIGVAGTFCITRSIGNPQSYVVQYLMHTIISKLGTIKEPCISSFAIVPHFRNCVPHLQIAIVPHFRNHYIIIKFYNSIR